MQTAIQDVRYALRQLAKSPGFALTAVISLALGIGATTAVFSIIYAVLMDPFPYRAADRIVRLAYETKSGASNWANLNGPQIRQLQRVDAIESVLAMHFRFLTMTGRDVPENVNAVELISTGFTDLGVPPVLGRALAPMDAPEGQDPQPVTVLAYRFWRQQFFGSPDVLGKTVQLDHRNYTIVGVAAPRFAWYSADVYLPLKLTQDPGPMHVVNIRLKPGVSRAAADAALQPLLEQFARDMPKRFLEHFRVRVEGLNDWVIHRMGGTLYLLFGTVGVLLAIACGNVSILLLARGAARQNELAIRVALGAGRRRIMCQLLTESLLLAAIGVALGVALSYGILEGVLALLPRFAFAPEVVIRINFPVLVFSGAVALITGVLFGLWPALHLSREHVAESMQSNARRVAGSVRGRRTHNALIAGQIALTLVLLGAAGSAMENFIRLLHAPLGYDPHNAMSLGLPLHENSYTSWSARAAYFEQLRSKVAETPGVTMSAISSNATPPTGGDNSPFEILGQPAAEQRVVSLNLVNQDYFPLLRIPLVEGRLWSIAENQAGAHVTVVNRIFAQRYFPNGGAIGHSVKLPGLESRPPFVLSPLDITRAWLPIVGVVADSTNDGLSNPVKPAVYIPYTLNMGMGTQILVRSQPPPTTLLRVLKAQLAAVNPDQQTYTYLFDLDTWISYEPLWQQEHLTAWIVGIFAVLAQILAAVGLYSVVSYTVTQRTNEFGIRIALGARRTDVVRLVFVSTLASVAAGLMLGAALTVAQWSRTHSRNPAALLAGAAMLCIVSAVACAMPAWRASQSDPMTALRCE